VIAAGATASDGGFVAGRVDYSVKPGQPIRSQDKGLAWWKRFVVKKSRFLKWYVQLD